MPKNQLLDLLFKLFAEKETWPIKLLREKTQQPEAFLKETLSDIAFLHRSGEHNGTWELKENFKEGVCSSIPIFHSNKPVPTDESTSGESRTWSQWFPRDGWHRSQGGSRRRRRLRRRRRRRGHGRGFMNIMTHRCPSV